MSLAEQCQQLAENVVKRVGTRLKEVSQSSTTIEMSLKGVADVVTEFDIWAEREIEQEILAAYPDHTIIGEESADELERKEGRSIEEIAREGVCWIIDPIDGTNNFANGIPHIGISVGVVINNVRSVGVVYDPFRDELFSASKGKAAFCNGSPIQVSKKNDLMQCVVATGFPYDRKNAWELCGETLGNFLSATRGVRRFGAATLDGCWVACGRFDCFYEYQLKAWDVAAISVLVEEAGGSLSNRNAAEEFSLFAPVYVLSNRTLHQKFSDLIRV